MSYLEIKEDLIANNSNLLDLSPAASFNFKGNSYTITTFQVLTNDISLINQELQNKLKSSLNFFYKAPIVIDLKTINENKQPIQILALKNILINQDLIPIAVINANIAQEQEALACNLAILHRSLKAGTIIYTNVESQDGAVAQRNSKYRKSSRNNQLDNYKESTNNNTYSTELIDINVRRKITTSSSTLIARNVRSGQQIYARGGDLIVMGSVSNGAELLADGHIHIYGCLRGRALAGVNGNTNARIFCNKLEAELISIAGQYMISENIEKVSWGVPTQIFIKDENLHITPL